MYNSTKWTQRYSHEPDQSYHPSSHLLLQWLSKTFLNFTQFPMNCIFMSGSSFFTLTSAKISIFCLKSSCFSLNKIILQSDPSSLTLLVFITKKGLHYLYWVQSIHLSLTQILHALLSKAPCRNEGPWVGNEEETRFHLILKLLKFCTSCAHVFYSLHDLLKKNMDYITMLDHYFVVFITLV